MIIDVSHYQDPAKIDYDVLCRQLDFVIIRTQYGSGLVDKHYKTHHKEFQKRGIPTHCYSFIRATSIQAMEKEARDFYSRTIAFDPVVWWLDIEQKTMDDMRAGIKAFVRTMRGLGAVKVGCYIGHTPQQQFGVDLADFDCLWVPRYGSNTGKPDKKPLQECDLWQYTDKGKLPGYSGYLDLNQLTGRKPLSFFTEKGDISTMKKGDKGEHVKQLQMQLMRLGYKMLPYGADGSYGSITEKAVKSFQSAHGLIVDGKVGSNTQARLKTIIDILDKQESQYKQMYEAAHSKLNEIKKIVG